uniref:hypothetical protein n=1 Tax=Klebsiella aerogenes TaxID=548 RepID=UPI000A67220E
ATPCPAYRKFTMLAETASVGNLKIAETLSQEIRTIPTLFLLTLVGYFVGFIRNIPNLLLS